MGGPWRGAPALLAEPPAYLPRTAAELAECLQDLEAFCAEAWSNYAVIKRLRELREHLMPALGSRHPVCCRLETLQMRTAQIDDPERLCRRVARIRSYVLLTLPPETDVFPHNTRWGSP